MDHVGTQKINGKKIELRQFLITDSEMKFKNWSSDVRVTKYLTWKPEKSIKETKKYLTKVIAMYNDKHYYHWCISEKNTNNIVGAIYARVYNETECEISFCIGFNWWGMGYMNESLKLVINFLFEKTPVNKIVAYTHVDNKQCQSLLIKLGMKFSCEINRESRHCVGFYPAKKYLLLKNSDM